MKNPGVPMLSETPVTLFSRPLQTPRGIQWGRSHLGRRGRIPRPYSPEYGAAPFGRCLKIPAKRPSQIETMCFDLKRRSHRAIRSFRSITVLRKWSERRVLRRGSLWRFLSPLSLAAKKAARRRRRDERTNRRDKRRIRRKAGTSPAAAGLTSQSSGFREVAHAHRCAVGPHSGREGPTLGRACYPSRGMRRRMPAPLSGEPILPAAAGIPLIRRFAPASPRESQSPLQRKTKALSSAPSGHFPQGKAIAATERPFPGHSKRHSVTLCRSARFLNVSSH
jgi:hypothetical protein